MDESGVHEAHGAHVFMDYTGFQSGSSHDGTWMLHHLQQAVSASNLREVHAHVEPFDGSVSPPGFAAVVLIDESHVTAHCYSDRGWLAIDCFTCGGTDPNTLADALHSELLAAIPTLKLMQRTHVPRFLYEG